MMKMLHIRIIALIATILPLLLITPFAYWLTFVSVILPAKVLFGISALYSWKKIKETGSFEARFFFAYSTSALIVIYSVLDYHYQFPFVSDRVILALLLLVLFWSIFGGVYFLKSKRVVSILMIGLAIAILIIFALLTGFFG